MKPRSARADLQELGVKSDMPPTALADADVGYEIVCQGQEEYPPEN